MELSKNEIFVSKRLMDLGAHPHLLGFYYLVEAISRVIKEPLSSQYITTQIYPAIAQHYDATAHGVERCIRTVITNIWIFGNKTLLKKWFFNYESYRPSNAQFITVAAMQLKFEIEELKSKKES